MKYFIDIYGCQMNVAESQGLKGLLQEAGWTETVDRQECDLLIFYSCCIRESAEAKVYGNIGAAKILKKQNPNLIIALGGCMAQKKDTQEKIKKSYSNVDILFGTAEPYRLLDYIIEHRQTRSLISATEGKRDMDSLMPTLHDSPVSAKVNIMHGCNNFCSYCIVPYVRGREISRSFDSIVNECKQLVDKGYREITLLGQNVNSYTCDGKNFADLLHTVGNLGGKYRIKFVSPHPRDMTKQVVDMVAQTDNLAKVIHLPLQAGSNRILQLMNRTYTRDNFVTLVEYIRQVVPNCSITTDIMVGFPTETEQDFLDTLDIVDRSKFNNIYSFVFSKRSGTVAANMSGHIDQATKRDRITRLIKKQSQIGQQHAVDAVGKQYEVLCVAHDKTKALCRTICDRLVTINVADIAVGQFANAKITATRNSNLIGEVVNQVGGVGWDCGVNLVDNEN